MMKSAAVNTAITQLHANVDSYAAKDRWCFDMTQETSPIPETMADKAWRIQEVKVTALTTFFQTNQKICPRM